MTEDFAPLLATIHRVCPDARLQTVAKPALAVIRQQHPGAPESYLAFLRLVGAGSLGGTFMIYDGLVDPGEIFPTGEGSLDGIAFFGDTFGSTILGFDTRRGWRLVAVDDHTLEVEAVEAQTIAQFIARRLAEQEEA